MAGKRWLSYVAAYVGWAACLILAIWTLLVWKNAFEAALSVFFIQGSEWRGIQSGFWDKAFVIVLGILWLCLMIISEQYLRKGASKQRLLNYLARLFGWIILITFVGDFFLFLLIGLNPFSWIHLLILVAELAVAIALLWLAKNYQKNAPKVKDPG